MVTVCLVGLLSFVALAADVGMMAVARTQAQATADIGALSGARTFNGLSGNNRTAAEAQARAAALNNIMLASQIAAGDISSVTSGVYRYDTVSQRFTADFSTAPSATESYGAMRVVIQKSQPTFFGQIMGINSMQIGATATAVHRPRDLAIVLDFSGSMKFSSEFNYPSISGSTPISGTLNADSRFPRFGPWALYPVATTGNNNPMHRVDAYVDGGGETHAVNNLTVESTHGPAMVSNFQTTAANNGPNALVYNGDLTGAGFNITNAPVCTPVPATWSSQYASGYAGDRWPLMLGSSTTTPTVANYAKTVADMLFATGTTITTSTRDLTWETNGYDSAALTFKNGTFKGYSMGPGYYGKTFYVWPPDPRYGASADPTNISASNPAQDASGNWICDWRKRFFLKPSATAGTKGAVMDDNSLLYGATGLWNTQGLGATVRYVPNYDAILKWLKNGPQTLPPAMRAGRVLYYSAIPDSIPMNWATGLISSTATVEERFWKEYIDFVIGCGQHNRAQTLNGNGTNNTFGGSTYGTVKITAKASLTGTSPPYMHYQDVPVHPRAHLWFGPLTMLGFISLSSQNQNYNWNAGTTNEAHCWQMKAGINSAMTDIQNNHPNDLASLNFFSSYNSYSTARVAMGKNYTKMQNCLFYPNSLVNSLGTLSSEKRPYASNGTISASVPSGLKPDNYGADIPLSAGGTDTAMGLMTAYNQLNYNGGYTGRRGATKIVILETDGVANANASATFSAISGGGGTKQWTGISSVSSGNGQPNAMNAAITLAWLITQNDTSSKAWPTFPAYSNLSGLPVANAPTNYYTQTGPGFSTSRSPAYVHTIAFGQLFEPSTVSNMKTRALEFLRNVQIAGGTSPAGATSIDSFKIIVGSYNARIDTLRTAMQTIMQGGVQVALVQ